MEPAITTRPRMKSTSIMENTAEATFRRGSGQPSSNGDSQPFNSLLQILDTTRALLTFLHYPHYCDQQRVGDNRLRIVLSNIGTLGDINPLIALALELKRRGHVPVMALPEVYRSRIVPVGLEFHAILPNIDPADNALVEMVYDIKHGTEH